jgi:DNA-binding FadR family transcriptional regulator
MTRSNRPGDVLSQITPVQGLDLNRAKEISSRLERIIAACGLKAGDSLGTKEDLRRRFQVSPGTMNEAVRILESRGVIEMRRGLRGGVFVSRIPMQSVLKGVAGTLDFNGATGEYSWAISTQLEPLVIAEATRNADVDSLAELNAAVEGMALAIADPLELPRRYWFFCRRLAELGSNPLLTAIYLSLLDVLEKRNGLLQQLPPGQLVAKCRQAVEGIASGNTFRTPKLFVVPDSQSSAVKSYSQWPFSQRDAGPESEDHDRKWARSGVINLAANIEYSSIPESSSHGRRPD